jgi:hypothetical protein
MHTRFEGHHGDLLFPANGIGELFLRVVIGLLLWRVGDRRKLGIATASGEEALLVLHMDGALGAVKLGVTTPSAKARGFQEPNR